MAGEALMNRVMHGGEHNVASDVPLQTQDDSVIADNGFNSPLGGNDFGISEDRKSTRLNSSHRT